MKIGKERSKMEKISKKIRKTCLKLSNICQDGNLQSAFSCIDILWVLYDKVMNWSPQIANEEDRDLFVISKGQATLALYSVLIEKGMFSFENMAAIGSYDSKFCIQADRTKFPEGGIENAAGSLGHGLPFAVGMAYANKIKMSPSKVYVLAGDGEFCEGTMWESCIFASAKGLDNLCVIIDDNDSVGSMVDMGRLESKLKSFGFEVDEVDGHNLISLTEVLRNSKKGKPRAIIARTLRGFGSNTMMKQEIWFHKAPSNVELAMLTEEVTRF